MTVIGSNPGNLGEPIGFAVLPDGRVLQTVRTGELRLHDPAAGTSTVINTIPVYTHSEDGLYGPAIDRQFATNRWVYLYYAPPLDTPPGNAPVTSPDPNAWDPFQGYFQLSRFKLVESPTPHLDLATEQQILRVPWVRGTCCHVAGEIRFQQKHQEAEVLPTQGTTTAFSPDTGGVQVVSIDPGDWISLDPVDFTNLDAITFRVAGGAAATAGAARAVIELHSDAPDGALVAAVTIRDTGGNNTFESQTTPITAPGGSRRLYLVFQPIAGGPATGLFNLNWFELVGGGIAE